MIQDPDFVLCLDARNDLERPRNCWRRKRLSDEIRDDYLLVDIEPPVIGQTYGRGDKDITQLILATRHQGVSLFPVNEWPAYVYVYRMLDETLLGQGTFEASQVEMILWGVILRSISKAGDDCATLSSHDSD